MSAIGFRASDAAKWSGGELVAGDAGTRLAGVSIDTRSLGDGELFVAVAGANHDAHAFLETAVAAGAGGLMVERGRPLPRLAADLPVVAADDTTRALGALAAGHRRGLEGPVVAVTGSNGKTTTKEMCAAILEVGAPTLRNRGNLNNQFGLPLTLLTREPRHRRAVVELGMNHRGEIAALAAIAQPTVGAVTNVGTAHIEHLGSREAIAAEKGDLLAALAESGTAVVPADDDFAEALRGRSRARALRFGLRPGADVGAEGVEARDGAFRFRLNTPEGSVAVALAGLGETTVSNALCAAAAALAAGATLDEIAEGLARYRPVPGRLERRALPNGVVVIDDSYNANPQSMELALRLLANSGAARRIAVLGDMGELGETAAKAHADTGSLAAGLALDLLVAVGRRAETVAAAARDAGMDPARIETAETSESAGPLVAARVRPGDWVLVKGSRAMRMERVAEHLEKEGRS